MRVAVAGAASTEFALTRPSIGRTLLVLVALMVLGLGPMLLMNSVALQAARERLLGLTVSNLTLRSVSTAASLDAYLQSRRRDIISVSTSPDVIAYAQNLNDQAQRGLARSVLALTAATGPEYESVALLSLDGTIMAASIQTDEGTNVRFRDYFQNARAGSAYISDPSYSVITNKPALFFSAPVRNTDGLLVGVVRSRVNLAVVWDLVEADQGSVGAGARGFLVDDFGIRLAVSETKNNRDKAETLIYKVIAPIQLDTAVRLAADRRFGQRSAEQLIVDPLPELKVVIDAMSRPATVPFRFDVAGVEQRAVATRLASKQWVYVVAMPPSNYTDVLVGASTIQPGPLVLAGALVALLAVLFARSPARRRQDSSDA